MKIETLKTADLIPYARNNRTHSPEQVALQRWADATGKEPNLLA